MPSPVYGRTTLGSGCTWMNSWSTDAGGAADSHPKFTTSCWYFVSIAKVDIPVGTTINRVVGPTRVTENVRSR